MLAIERSLNRNRALARTTWDRTMQLKAAGVPLVPEGGLGQMSQYREQSSVRRRYGLFHGWVHSAVNALAEEGASQDITLKRLQPTKKPKGKKDAKTEFETIPDHPILDRLRHPNPTQHQFQFVYSFIANLCLTGWGFIVADEDEDEIGIPTLYSLPTSWVRPIHKKGPFAEFVIVNPQDPASEADQKPIPKSQVAFAHFPNPADPIAAMAPAAAQNLAIEIDDKIQTSQRSFFDNGIFPSVIVTVGKNPHPDVPAGVRPRLTATQRRQVQGAIQKTMGGVAKYGSPGIVDGLVEKIERLSATSNEMGWDRSERAAKMRILSAFGVHPFILGEHVGVGGYAQVFNIEKRFGKKVNVFLHLLSTVITDFVSSILDVEDAGLSIDYGPFEPVDPQMEKSMWDSARGKGDVSQNEYRQYMGLPPDEDANPAVVESGTIPHVLAVAGQVTGGQLNKEQGIAILEGIGLPTKLAKLIAGKGASEKASQEQAVEEMEEAIKLLRTPLVFLES